MQLLVFKSLIDKANFKILIQNITICVLALGLVIVSFVTYSVYRSKRTIIIPSTLNSSLSISDIDVSPETLKVMIYSALDLLLSYQIDSVQNRFETFLKSYAYPSRVRDIRDQLAKRMREIQQLKMSQTFEPENFLIREKGVVLVAGRIIPAMLGQVTKSEPIYMRIDYRLVEGSVKIANFFNLTRSEYDRVVRRGLSEEVKQERRDESRSNQKKTAERNQRLQQSGQIEQYKFDPDTYRDTDLGDDLEPKEKQDRSSSKPSKSVL